jgi:hypothetical protein
MSNLKRQKPTGIGFGELLGGRVILSELLSLFLGHLWCVRNHITQFPAYRGEPFRVGSRGGGLHFLVYEHNEEKYVPPIKGVGLAIALASLLTAARNVMDRRFVMFALVFGYHVVCEYGLSRLKAEQAPARGVNSEWSGNKSVPMDWDWRW